MVLNDDPLRPSPSEITPAAMATPISVGVSVQRRLSAPTSSRRRRRRSVGSLTGSNLLLLSGLALAWSLLTALPKFSRYTGDVDDQGKVSRASLLSRLLVAAEDVADDAVEANAEQADRDDDYFQFDENIDFDEVSVMPVSCVNYNNGHMIKFQFFEKSSSLNCHFKNLGTFVVSIAHYMRAYFNYQALLHGDDFSLPGDVGFLNCVMLKETQYADQKLYAKIGCQHRDTYTSTKLQLTVYKDAQCSQLYEVEDDENNKSDGYDINGYFLSSKVSFRPPFYSCQSCLPDAVSYSFSKKRSPWYDDDYISKQGKKKEWDDDAAADDAVADDGADDGNNAAAADDAVDDAAAGDGYDDYFKANDDIYNYDDAGGNGGDDNNNNNNNNNDDTYNYYNNYVNHDDNVQYNYQAHDDDFYSAGDDDSNRRNLRQTASEEDASKSLTGLETLKEYESGFRQEMAMIHRQLEDANEQQDDANEQQDDRVVDASYIGAWNMCDRVYKYGMFCDEDCRALDTFRVDEWSRSDVFLLVIMCVFMGAMMLLVFAKRVKAYERAAMWGDEPGAPNPGLPPMAMFMLFAVVFTVIIVLAALKFVNATLVFAVVTCILLFIYMLKLTLFESRKPQFLPARSTRNHSLKEPFY